MQQRVRRVVFVAGGASLVAAGLLLACGTDNGSTPTPTPTAEGGGGGRDGGGGGEGGTQTDGSTPGEGGTDADCTKAPKLRDNSMGFFCAFYRGDNGDGGTTQYCQNDEICCNTSAKYADGGFAPSFCAPATAGADKGGVAKCAAEATNEGSAPWVDGGSAWECNDNAGCGTGQVCCLTTQAGATGIVNIGKSLDKDIPAECNAKQAFKQGGTKCVTGTACAADQIKLCSTNDNNCTGGSVCTPFSGFFRDLGYCFP